MAKIDPVKELTKHPGLWRVNGYSHLELSHKVPKIHVWLSQIHEQYLHAPLDPRATMGIPLGITVNLNKTSDLLVGSCWRGGIKGGGRRVSTLPLIEKHFTVDTTKIQFFKLGNEISLSGEEFSTVLPTTVIDFEQPYDSKNHIGHSLYAVVPVLNDPRTRYLVISCNELYRAYLGVSSRFMNAIITRDIGRYFEWHPPYLKVNQKLSRVEQFVIYRGYTSKEVCKSLYLPSNYIKSTTYYNANNIEALKLPYIVKSGFPFDGRTNLTVSGKLFTNVSRGAKRVPFVFAANLLRCTKEYDQKVQILSDTYSKPQAPWKLDVGSDTQSNDVLLDEHSEEVDTPSTAGGRKISMLRPTNTFDAMNHLDIEHTHTGDTINPVYENDIGDDVDRYSHQDIAPNSENGEHVLQGGQFDSHVYEVDRTLANFISMIIALRALVLARKWEVTTRSCSGALIVEQDEIITAFSKDKNARRKWHIIENEGSERMRQIVWVEIALNEEQFIYLTEMELKGSEKSRSTLLIMKQEFAYMEEGDFCTFLELAKIRNGWPRVSQDWESKGVKEAASDYFDSFEHAGISHTGVNKKQPEAWAKEIEIKISELLGLPPLEEVN